MLIEDAARANVAVSPRASSRSAPPTTVWKNRSRHVEGGLSMNCAALTMPNGTSASHSACRQLPEV